MFHVLTLSVPEQHSNSASFAKGVSWDFSSVDEDDDYKSDGSVLSVTSADGSDGRTSERAEGNEDASSEKSRQERKFLFRHEPRGDPDPSRSLSPGQELSSFQLKQSAQHEGQAQQKRGRFMVNGAESTVTDAGSGVPLTCGEPSTVTSATGCPVRKTQVKISQQEQLVGSVLGNADAAPSSPVSQQQPPHGEIRKGRFCVGPATGVQQGSATTGSSDSTPGTTQTSPCTSSLHSQYGSRRERADSWDSVGNRSDAECPERKSRFQIEPVLGQISSGGECQTGGGAGSPALPLNRAILSATGTGNLSHETSIGRTGRFAVESAAGPGSGLQETTGGQGHQSEEKRGRFSVSSVDSRIEPRNTITDGHQASGTAGFVSPQRVSDHALKTSLLPFSTQL
ncbi:MAG: hypothetical protein BJ554DRAFT_5290 [Olpidium bornovanus]|uniref:Uncharacterized protein n=1 Tax=Olpidium bornovanus TaxID=278681 RepID=A0A8H8A013_9FUNG|nr:MAG: hypothetical protein BJ554DRAFT_5290 [Olpidium bornovanus]